MKVVRFTSQVVLWLVILTALTAVALAVAVPRIAGGTPYTVLTGSMEPDLPPAILGIATASATAATAVRMTSQRNTWPANRTSFMDAWSRGPDGRRLRRRGSA